MNQTRSNRRGGPACPPLRTVRISVLTFMAFCSSMALAGSAEDLARSRVEHTRVVLAQVRSALDLYMVQKGSYPTAEQGPRVLE